MAPTDSSHYKPNDSGKHKWKSNKCTICGAERTKEPNWFHGWDWYYERSGINFHDKRPECLDWNDNKLD